MTKTKHADKIRNKKRQDADRMAKNLEDMTFGLRKSSQLCRNMGEENENAKC